MKQNNLISRRTMLRQGVGMLGSMVLIPIVLESQTANAGSDNKAMLHYQDHPNEDQMCSQCTAFSPGAEPDSGTCKVVGGAVSGHGWCMAFSRR